MADRGSANGIERSLERQVEDLRKQLSHLTSDLASHGIDVEHMTGGAEDVWRGARKKARRAARNVQHDADVISRAVQKAPAGTGTVLAVAAAVGFGLGYLYHFTQRH